MARFSASWSTSSGTVSHSTPGPPAPAVRSPGPGRHSLVNGSGGVCPADHTRCVTESTKKAEHPTGDRTPVFYASPTKLALWRQCRRRYRFRYVDRIPAKDRPWLAFGQSIHGALKDLFDLRPENRTWERLERAYRRNWVRRGFESEDEERAYFERGLGALRRVFEGEDLGVPRPRLLEFSLQALEGDVVLCGKVDRVDDTPSGLVLTDYKTGRPRAPERALVDTAFTMYALLMLARFKRAPSKLVWDFVETGDKIVTERSAAALGRAKDDLLRLVAEVRADTEFPPSPGPFCATCDYLERCPEGRRAVPAAAVEEPPAELLPQPGEE